MARRKGTRKPSAAQRNPEIVAIAKQLKKAGILSKQTKLHGGKYVSKEVAKRALEFQTAARFGYVAVPVKKELAEQARAQGFQVVRGNRVIVPPRSEVRAHLKKGELAGVVPLPGGYMEIVQLPHDLYSIRQLFNLLQSGDLDKLKAPDEYFAFQLMGHMSHDVFQNSRELFDRIKHYKIIADAEDNPEYAQDLFQSFQITRLVVDDVGKFIPTVEERKKTRKRNARTKRGDDGESYYQVRMKKLHPQRKQRYKKRKVKEQKEYRDSLSPEKKEIYKQKARERAKKSYEGKKKK